MWSKLPVEHKWLFSLLNPQVLVDFISKGALQGNEHYDSGRLRSIEYCLCQKPIFQLKDSVQISDFLVIRTDLALNFNTCFVSIHSKPYRFGEEIGVAYWLNRLNLEWGQGRHPVFTHTDERERRGLKNSSCNPQMTLLYAQGQLWLTELFNPTYSGGQWIYTSGKMLSINTFKFLSTRMIH